MAARRRNQPPTQAPERVTRHFARWTGPREEVFNVLVRTRQHLSAKDLFDMVRPSNPAIGLTTIYRTLEVLDRAGLVRRTTTQSGEVRFEYKRGDQNDHHHHLICTNCEKIVNYRDFEKEELDLVGRCEALLSQKYGFLIRDHNIEFMGLCPECRPGGLHAAGRRPGRRPASVPAPRSPKGRHSKTAR